MRVRAVGGASAWLRVRSSRFLLQPGGCRRVPACRRSSVLCVCAATLSAAPSPDYVGRKPVTRCVITSTTRRPVRGLRCTSTTACCLLLQRVVQGAGRLANGGGLGSQQLRQKVVFLVKAWGTGAFPGALSLMLRPAVLASRRVPRPPAEAPHVIPTSGSSVNACGPRPHRAATFWCKLGLRRRSSARCGS